MLSFLIAVSLSQAGPSVPPTTDAPTTDAPTTDAPASPADGALIHLEKAQTAIGDGDLAAAREALEKALEVDPQNLDAMRGLALILMQTEEPTKAVGYLEKILELDPYDDDARLDLGRAQALAGAQDAAKATVGAVLERHPEHGDALALKASLDGGEAAAPSKWQPLVRASADFSYDTNVALENGPATSVTEIGAASTIVNVLGGVAYAAGDRPLSVFGFASMQTTFDQKVTRNGTTVDVNDFMPSVLGLAATGRLRLGPIVGALDLRYSEIFTNIFQKHIGRMISPSLAAAWQIHPTQRLRLLVGPDIHMPYFHTAAGYEDGEVNAAIQTTVRDTMSLGDLTLVVDLAYKHNLATNDPYTRVDTGFNEIGGMAYVEYAIIEDLAAFVFFDGRGRFFDPDPASGSAGANAGFSEGTLRGQAGARFTIAFVELHAEYGISGTVVDTATFNDRQYLRHQVSVGARFWYP